MFALKDVFSLDHSLRSDRMKGVIVEVSKKRHISKPKKIMYAVQMQKGK